MASLSIDGIIGGLTVNKVFLPLNVNPRFEQGSPLAKSVVTLPKQCMAPSILGVCGSKRSSVSHAQPRVEEVQAVQAPTPTPVPVSAQAQAQAQAPATPRYTLKDLKKEKAADIKDIATKLGIPLFHAPAASDPKTKPKAKVKDELIADIMAAT